MSKLFYTVYWVQALGDHQFLILRKDNNMCRNEDLYKNMHLARISYLSKPKKNLSTTNWDTVDTMKFR